MSDETVIYLEEMKLKLSKNYHEDIVWKYISNKVLINYTSPSKGCFTTCKIVPHAKSFFLSDGKTAQHSRANGSTSGQGRRISKTGGVQ